MKLRLRLLGGWLGIGLTLVWKPSKGRRVVGITNKVGHLYVPFLDYDVKNPLFLGKELESLQRTYGLGNCYLFETKRGYHVIFLDLITYSELLEILNASTCDRDYINVPQHNDAKAWVLRTTEKDTGDLSFIGGIRADSKHNISYPHLEWLRWRGVPLEILPSSNIEMKRENLITATYEV